jgi:uncharacterized membrane protein YphA (DoxX/SURF4 family)
MSQESGEASMIVALGNRMQDLMDAVRKIDFIGPLALRLYLAPVFWVAGTNKMSHIDSTIEWFGNSDWGLGLPFPELMAWMAAGTEVIGAILLVSGFAIRWVAIPLIATMLVAIFAVHLDNGWQAIHDLQSPWANENAAAALERIAKAKDILREHGNYKWLTEHGNFVVSNNGIEWAATYLAMLLGLFATGAGKYLSADYWISRRYRAG